MDTSVHVFQQKWFSFTKDPNDDIATHISKIGDLCYTLRALKEDISDSMMITKILMTLSPNYNHFRSAWDSVANDRKTIENLTSRLTIEETRMSSQEKSENSAFALRDRRDTQKYANKGESQNREMKDSRNHRSHAGSQTKKQGCWNCGRQGHKRKDCWLLPGNERPNGSTSERSSHNNNTAKQRDAIVGEMLITPKERADRSTS